MIDHYIYYDEDDDEKIAILEQEGHSKMCAFVNYYFDHCICEYSPLYLREVIEPLSKIS
jgi:hypothetical protein